MKRWIGLGLWWSLLHGAALVACGAADAPTFDGDRAFRDLVAQVDIGPRPPGSSGSAATRQLIRARLKDAGWNVVEQPFLARPPTGSPVSMTNLVATRPGRTDQRIVLAAHYDTKDIPGARFLGANDGASGVAVLLELARALGAEAGRHTLELVFFDGEEAFGPSITPEDGLYGSRELALRMTQEGTLGKLRALIVFDMVGDRDLRLAVDLRSSPELRRIAMEEGRGLVEWGREMAIIDDHAPFLERGVASVLVLIDFEYGGPSSPGSLWHTGGDDLDAVSADSLRRVGELGIKLVERLEAEVPREQPRKPERDL